MKLRHQGSVKDIYEISGSDQIVFDYSDRYSVFDWGHMPDTIPGKGVSIARAAHSFFKMLGSSRVPHACLGFCDENGKIQEQPSSRLRMKQVQIVRPAFEDGVYNYTAFKSRPKGTLIPLEVIFRFGLPNGSSFAGRYLKDPGYFERTYGIERLPAENGFLQKPIVEFFTKLEHSDRALKWNEARQICGMTIDELQDLADVTLIIAEKIRRLCQKNNLTLWDGKLEWAWDDDGKLMLVDSIGIDELRITAGELVVSKEILRQYYRSTPWYKEISAFKETGDPKWKEKVSAPTRLPEDLVVFVSKLYERFADALDGKVNPTDWHDLKEKQKWLRQTYTF